MALNSMGLGFEFWAKDRGATATMRKVRKETQKTGDAAKDLERKQKAAAQRTAKRGAAAVAAGVGVLAVVNKATKAFGEFEFIITAASAKMIDGAQNLEALKKAAFEAGKLTQFSPEEAAQGLSELGAQGLTATESIKALRPVLDLAAGSMGQLGVAEAAGVAMASLNAFGKTVNDLPDVVDKLTVVSDGSAFQMRDFQIAISQAASQAKAADQSFESMLAVLGLLRDAGNEASTAATAYREAMRRLAGDKLALKEMKKLGVTSVDSKGQMKDLADIVAELHPALQKLGVQQRNLALKTIFGVRGMKAYSAIINSYEKNLKKGLATSGEYTKGHQILMDRLGKSHGAAAVKVKKALDTTGGQYRLLSGSWKNTVIKFGELFAKVMLPVLKRLTSLLNDLVDMIDSMDPVTKKIVGQTIVWGAVIMTVVGAFKVLRGLMMMMSIGRLAGRYIAGQAAMATSTATTTTAVTAQNTALAVSTTRMGRARAAAGAFASKAAAAASSVAAVGAAAVATGWFLSKWMIKRLDNGASAAQKAQDKITRFRLSFRAFNRTIKRGSDHMSSFNQKLRAQTQLLIKSASRSSKSAEKVLSKVTATVGRLSIARQRALVGMYKAIRKKDIASATAHRKQAFEIERKMATLAQARVHIRARQYNRDIRHVKDRSKREHMAQTILLSGVIKQQELEMGFAKKRATLAAGIRAIDDPIEREKAVKKANALWAKQQAQVSSGQMRIAKQGQRLGLLPKGFVSTADYDKIFARMKPLMRSTGVMGSQLQLSLRQLGAARKGVAVGRMTPGRTRAFGELREAAALAFGRSKQVAAGERSRYETSLKQGTAASYRAKPAAPVADPAENIRGYLQFWTAGLAGNQEAQLGDEIRMAYKEARVQLDININPGDNEATAKAKQSARGGGRFKPTIRTTGGK
ncbi:MAG: phage tail tape measure protein [bacterium]|nr:phage tail tape measure protein [bacterium]